MWRATFIMLFKPLSQIASRTDIRLCWARAGLEQVDVVHHKAGAGDEARTRDVHLGKVVLYQLSYTRSFERDNNVQPTAPCNRLIASECSKSLNPNRAFTASYDQTLYE
jgi:hypothetical protein